MVLRNTTKRSREELQPCRQPVDAGATKKALSTFIAACRTTATATTIALTVSLAGGCMGTPLQRTVGEPLPNRIDPLPAAEPEALQGRPIPLMGDMAPAHITTDDEDE